MMQTASKICRVLVVAAGLSAGAPSFAQNSPNQASSQGNGQLEEIVVSAQRREQDSQKVPISISTVSEKDAERMGIRSTDELAAVVPGLSYFQLFNGAAFFIRGVGKSDTNTGQELPVAVYVDGVYLATPTGGIFSLNNIDHVEVLKGPQGTLFGRNATGGVVQVITKQPQQDASLDASAGFGNYGKQQESLYGTMGITSTLAADIAAYYTSQSSGWGHNINLNTDVYMPREFDLRSKWLWTPTDHTSITLAGDFSNVYSDVGTAIAIWPPSVGFLGYRNVGWYNIDSDIEPFSAYQQFGVTLTANQDIDWSQLHSISSYHDLKERVNYDGDATPFFGEVAGRKYPADTFTQELQLLAPKGSPIQWIGGLYFLNQTTATNPLTISGLALGAGPTFVLNQDASQHTDSYAAYSEATFPIVGDDTHLTTGARYTVDKRELWSKSNDNFGDPYPTINQSAKWSSPTWRAVLDHQFTPDVFSYLQYSRGFKSGQFNVIAPSSPPVQPEKIDAYEFGTKTMLFDRRLRLNGSIYYYKYTDIQLTRVIVGGNELYNAAEAKAKGADGDFDFAVTRNFELKGGVSYFDGDYSSFPNAPGFYPAVGGGNNAETINASGKFMIDSPKWEGNLAAVYTLSTAVGSFTLTALYSVNSGYFWEPDNRVKQPEFNIVNATLEWKTLSQAFGVRLWGKNLTDAEYVSFNTENAFGDQYSVSPPRTYGFDLLYHFGK